MIGYLRDLISKTKKGEKYGKFVSSLFFAVVMTAFQYWKLSFPRKLRTPICGWLHLHWSCKHQCTACLPSLLSNFKQDFKTVAAFKSFNSDTLQLCRLMVVWHQSKVSGLFSLMDQGLYSVYLYVQLIIFSCQNLKLHRLLFFL